MNRSDIETEHRRQSGRFEQLRAESVYALDSALRASNVKLHSLTSRIKSVDSIVRKADLKHSDRPFEQFHDIVGLRVVCLFLSDIPRIAAIVREEFSVLSEENKIDPTDPASFGYMSYHVDVTMKSTHAGPRYDGIRGMPAEIQVRTIAMDAWANVSHHLSYHSDLDVPSELKRDFYALSGLFYVADRHFELFFQASVTSREEAIKVLKSASLVQVREQPLNADTVAAYLAEQFPDRTQSDPEVISELLQELAMDGVRTIGELHDIVLAAAEAFRTFEASGSFRYASVGFVRGALYMYDSEFSRNSYRRQYPAGDFEHEFAQSESRFAPYRDLVKRH